MKSALPRIETVGGQLLEGSGFEAEIPESSEAMNQ